MKKIFTQNLKTTKLGFYTAILAAAIGGTLLNSCSKSASTAIASPEIVEFGNGGATVVGAYYLKPTNAPFAIPMGFANLSDQDRSISVTFSSKTAVAGSQYTTPPASLTIKAGKALDTLRFAGIFAGYPTGRKDTISVKVNGYKTPDNNPTYKFVVQPYCDVIAANLVGNYTQTVDYYPSVSAANASAAKYTVNISNWTATSATTATILIKGLGNTGDVGFAPFAATDPAATGITATLDWTNAASFKVAIASQPYVASLYSYGASTISSVSGSFSSCDQTFTISYSVKVSAGTFTGTTSVLKR